jgi:hypothetical protein
VPTNNASGDETVVREGIKRETEASNGLSAVINTL